MLTREQIAEVLAEKDEKYLTAEVKREAVIDFIENIQLKAQHEGEQADHDRKIAEWKK